MRYILILFTFFVFIQTTSATTFSEVAIQLQPEYPKPGDKVQISLKSYSQNLQGLNIEWLIGDNVLLKEGQGLTDLTLTAPLLGEQINLTIKVSGVVMATYSITPTAVDILWEAQTYTPKYYLGRALPVDSSQIIAVAIPHLGGEEKDTTKLIYNWYKGGKFLINSSGAGKSTLTTASPGLYDDYNLSVEVTDSLGKVLGQNGVHITTIEPKLIFYNILPLVGTNFSRALSTNSVNSSVIENLFTAIPYYFSINEPQELAYTWKISNAQSIQETQPNNLTITSTRQGSTISLIAQHPDILLQFSNIVYQFTDTNSLFNDYPTGESYESPFGNIE